MASPDYAAIRDEAAAALLETVQDRQPVVISRDGRSTTYRTTGELQQLIQFCNEMLAQQGIEADGGALSYLDT